MKISVYPLYFIHGNAFQGSQVFLSIKKETWELSKLNKIVDTKSVAQSRGPSSVYNTRGSNNYFCRPLLCMRFLTCMSARGHLHTSRVRLHSVSSASRFGISGISELYSTVLIAVFNIWERQHITVLGTDRDIRLDLLIPMGYLSFCLRSIVLKSQQGAP